MYRWSTLARKFDWLLTSAVLFLLVFGLLMMFSFGLNDPASQYLLFKKQLLFAVVGLILYAAVATMNHRIWQTFSKLIYWFFAFVLILVILFGRTINGTTGWLQIAGFGLQPVEFAKVAVVIFLAKYFSQYAREFFLWRHILISGASVMFIVGLILLQPDLGSSMVIVASWILMLLIVGVRKLHIATIFIAFVVVALASWLWVLHPYQKERILTFVNPQSDPLDRGYNVRQSVIAVGSGQLIGRGYALGSQSQLHFLPEPETDFIFAVISEEFGFVGVLLILLAYSAILYRLTVIANKTRDNYAAYYCLGLGAVLLVQIFINVGMNMGIAPVTGIPLPFLSAGGSSMIAILIALAMANNMAAENRS